MTTSQSLIIRRKSGQSLDLTTAPYSIGRDFAIPALAQQINIATGSSANVYSGGLATSLKYNDRSWVFEIRILSTTDTAIRLAARKVSDFLLTINKTDPTYIEYRPNTDTPEPLWGQYGAALRYEVITAITSLNIDYADGTLRDRRGWLTISAVIKPAAETKQQRVCTATGGIQEDVIGSTDGRSFGTIIPEATTNKMTNPVFGHATFGNGWTAAASLTAVQNTDERWFIPGTASSAYLTAVAATNNTYTQSIAAGNTNKHSLNCFAKLQDGSAISATQMQLWYNAALTTTYTSLGNGWYWLRSENFDGIAAATATGVLIKNGYAAYVIAFQLEEKAYSTRPAWGDMLGCAWTGTAHASTSTRTAASCKLPISNQVIDSAAGSVRMVVRFDVPNTFADYMYLFDTQDGTHLTALTCYFNPADDKFYFGNAAALASTSAKTFSAGTIYVFHFVWSPAGVAIYVNGAQDGTATYAIAPAGANLFIGSHYGSGNQVVGAISFATSDQAFTATQALNDYTNILPTLARGERPGSIPWFWTDDGDNILSIDTGKLPLGIVAGVPGTLPALTEIQGALSSNLSTIKSFALSSYGCSAFLGVNAFFYGSDQTTTVNSTTVAVVLSPANPVLAPFIADQINGMEYHILSRLSGSAATAFYLYSVWTNSSIANSASVRAITPAAGSANRLFRTNLNKISFNTKGFTGISSTQVSHYIYGLKIASNVDITVDYIAIFPRPCIFITGGQIATTGFAIKGFEAYHSSSGFNSYKLDVTGDPIEFQPNKLNHLQCYFCVDETVDPATTYQATLSTIYITPRWALL